MPIWRSSELLVDRTGSPARRRSSARSPASQASVGLASAPPPLRGGSADGRSPNEQAPGAAAAGSPAVAVAAWYPSPHRSAGGCSTGNSFGGGENPHCGYPSAHPTAPRGLSRQPPAPRPDSRGGSGGGGGAAVVGACAPGGPRANSYTVQYIGIANGELGILSQKQKLTIPITVPGTGTSSSGAAPASNVVLCRHASQMSNATAASSSPLAHSRGATAAAAAAATVRPPLPPSRPTSSTARPPLPPSPLLTAAAPDAGDAGPSRYDTGAVSPVSLASPAASAGAGGGFTETETEDESPAGRKPMPPSLVNIVDDAHGQVKVITECFYSRALHSRAAPHDRHARRNRPVGPQVRDMEPLSTGLPGCFAHRAPSAGGFPGWRRTMAAASAAAAGGAPRRTYSGSGSGFFGSGSGNGSGAGSGAGTGPSKGLRQTRAVSAQPRTGSGEAAAAAEPT